MTDASDEIDCASRLKILAVEARLSVVRWLMEFRSGTVSEIGAALDIEQSLLSHHLRKLRDAGLVESVQKKKTRIYSLSESASESLKDGKLNLGCCSIDFES